jgi:uncharacterized protein DUF4105
VTPVSRSVGQSVVNYVRAGLALAAVTIFPAQYGWAQQRPPDRPTAGPPELTVYLMTMGPGKHVWERFGHNAIWIHDPVHGTDQTYNYGLFDFRQHNFLLRFIQGRMWYWMEGFPAQSYVDSYRRNNRSVWIQELEIAPEKRRELQAFLEWNEQPEHRFYHYDYYLDNCSTRVRDALDRALDGRLRAATVNVTTPRTYRFHTQRLTANDPPIFTGLLLALGHRVDRPITAWQEMFLPLAMREWVRTVRVIGTDGHERPLVRSERTLFQASEPTPPAQPPMWLWRYLAVGIVLAGLLVALAPGAAIPSGARWAFLLIAWIWCLVSGVAGLVLAGLWGLTDHAAAYNNENVLQADVLSLLLIWFVTRLVFGRRTHSRAALILAGLIAAIALLGFALKLSPQFYQTNGEVIALALPTHLGVLAGLYRLQATQDARTRASASLASG